MSKNIKIKDHLFNSWFLFHHILNQKEYKEMVLLKFYKDVFGFYNKYRIFELGIVEEDRFEKYSSFYDKIYLNLCFWKSIKTELILNIKSESIMGVNKSCIIQPHLNSFSLILSSNRAVFDTKKLLNYKIEKNKRIYTDDITHCSMNVDVKEITFNQIFRSKNEQSVYKICLDRPLDTIERYN